MAKHGKFGAAKFGTGHFGWEWQDVPGVSDPEPISVSTHVYKRVGLRISILEFRMLPDLFETQVLEPKVTKPERALVLLNDVPRVVAVSQDGMRLKITAERVMVGATVLEHVLLTADASHQNTLGIGEEEVI